MNRRSFDINLLNALLSHLKVTSYLSLFIWMTACGAACAVTVIGCAWGGIENSVRFRLDTSEREFGRLPPLPMNALKQTQNNSASGDDEDRSSTHAVKRINALWDEAQTAESE